MDNQCWRTLSRVQSPVGAQNNYNYNYVLSIPAEAEREGTLVTNSAITRRIYPHYTGLGSAFHSVVTGDSYNTHSTLPMLQVFRRRGEGREMEDKKISGYCLLNHLLDQQRILQIFLD